MVQEFPAGPEVSPVHRTVCVCVRVVVGEGGAKLSACCGKYIRYMYVYTGSMLGVQWSITTIKPV